MKWYQPIECDNTVKNPFVADSDNLEEFGFSDNDFLRGEKIAEWPNSIEFKARKLKNDGDPDDVLQNHLMIPIFSEELKKTLTANQIAGIQFLPVSIVRPDSSLLCKHYIANFTFLVEAFDFSESQFNIFSENFPNPNVRGKIAGVRKFVLKRDEIKDYNVFRLKEYESRFFVSEIFVKLFKRNKFTGYSFVEVRLT